MPPLRVELVQLNISDWLSICSVSFQINFQKSAATHQFVFSVQDESI